MSDLGKILIFFGLTLVVAGGLLVLFGRTGGFGPGRLPGDILIRRDNTVFYFPLTSSLLVSALVSLVLYLVRR
jgi:hypothetical protein